MIQCPATGALDLELGELTHTGKKSFAITTPQIFQHIKALDCHSPLAQSLRAQIQSNQFAKKISLAH